MMEKKSLYIKSISAYKFKFSSSFTCKALHVCIADDVVPFWVICGTFYGAAPARHILIVCERLRLNMYYLLKMNKANKEIFSFKLPY